MVPSALGQYPELRGSVLTTSTVVAARCWLCCLRGWTAVWVATGPLQVSPESGEAQSQHRVIVTVRSLWWVGHGFILGESASCGSTAGRKPLREAGHYLSTREWVSLPDPFEGVLATNRSGHTLKKQLRPGCFESCQSLQLSRTQWCTVNHWVKMFSIDRFLDLILR